MNIGTTLTKFYNLKEHSTFFEIGSFLNSPKS